MTTDDRRESLMGAVHALAGLHSNSPDGTRAPDATPSGSVSGGTAPAHNNMSDEAEARRKHPSLGYNSKTQTFPETLMHILNDPVNDNCISWLPHGCAFRIHNREKFLGDVYSKYEENRKIKWTSFTRKLCRWNFERVTRGPDDGAYFHKMFLRDHPELVEKMECRRTGVTKTEQARATQAAIMAQATGAAQKLVHEHLPAESQPDVIEQRVRAVQAAAQATKLAQAGAGGAASSSALAAAAARDPALASYLGLRGANGAGAGATSATQASLNAVTRELDNLAAARLRSATASRYAGLGGGGGGGGGGLGGGNDILSRSSLLGLGGTDNDLLSSAAASRTSLLGLGGGAGGDSTLQRERQKKKAMLQQELSLLEVQTQLIRSQIAQLDQDLVAGAKMESDLLQYSQAAPSTLESLQRRQYEKEQQMERELQLLQMERDAQLLGKQTSAGAPAPSSLLAQNGVNVGGGLTSQAQAEALALQLGRPDLASQLGLAGAQAPSAAAAALLARSPSAPASAVASMPPPLPPPVQETAPPPAATVPPVIPTVTTPAAAVPPALPTESVPTSTIPPGPTNDQVMQDVAVAPATDPAPPAVPAPAMVQAPAAANTAEKAEAVIEVAAQVVAEPVSGPPKISTGEVAAQAPAFAKEPVNAIPASMSAPMAQVDLKPDVKEPEAADPKPQGGLSLGLPPIIPQRLAPDVSAAPSAAAASTEI